MKGPGDFEPDDEPEIPEIYIERATELLHDQIIEKAIELMEADERNIDPPEPNDYDDPEADYRYDPLSKTGFD